MIVFTRTNCGDLLSWTNFVTNKRSSVVAKLFRCVVVARSNLLFGNLSWRVSSYAVCVAWRSLPYNFISSIWVILAGTSTVLEGRVSSSLNQDWDPLWTKRFFRVVSTRSNIRAGVQAAGFFNSLVFGQYLNFPACPFCQTVGSFVIVFTRTNCGDLLSWTNFVTNKRSSVVAKLFRCVVVARSNLLFGNLSWRVSSYAVCVAWRSLPYNFISSIWVILAGTSTVLEGRVSSSLNQDWDPLWTKRFFRVVTTWSNLRASLLVADLINTRMFC